MHTSYFHLFTKPWLEMEQFFGVLCMIQGSHFGTAYLRKTLLLYEEECWEWILAWYWPTPAFSPPPPLSSISAMQQCHLSFAADTEFSHLPRSNHPRLYGMGRDGTVWKIALSRPGCSLGFRPCSSCVTQHGKLDASTLTQQLPDNASMANLAMVFQQHSSLLRGSLDLRKGTLASSQTIAVDSSILTTDLSSPLFKFGAVYVPVVKGH